MNRYEFKDDTSEKFWEVAVDGTKMTVRYGRMGTQGQTKEKTFASAAAAEQEKKKLVKEKTTKGYVAAGEVAAPAPKVLPPTKVASSTAPTKAEPVPAPVAADAKAAKSAVTEVPLSKPAATEDIECLIEAAPLPTRTRPGAMRSPEDDWAAFAQSLVKLSTAGSDASRWPLEIVKDGPPKALTLEQAVDWTRKLLEASSTELPYHNFKSHLIWPDYLAMYAHFANWLTAAHGTVLAAQVADQMRLQKDNRSDYRDSAWSHAPSLVFRSAITCAPVADYEAALKWCLKQHESVPDWRRDANFAFILADDRQSPHALKPLAVLEEAVRQGADAGAERCLAPLIAEAPPSLTKAWRAKRTYHLYFGYFGVSAAQIAATVMAAARGFGESPLPILDWLLHYATDDDRATLACAILDTREDDGFPPLLPYLHEKPIREAFDRATKACPRWMFQTCLNALAAGRAEHAIRARVMAAVQHHGAKTAGEWAQAAGGRTGKYLETLTAATTEAAAPPQDWPPFLRTPPWREKKKASGDIVLQIAPKPTSFVFTGKSPEAHPQLGNWIRRYAFEDLEKLAVFIAQAEVDHKVDWKQIPPAMEPPPAAAAGEEAVVEWMSRRIGALTTARKISYSEYRGLFNALEFQPDFLAPMMWEKTSTMQNIWGMDWPRTIPAMMARYGEKALPGLVRLVEADPLALLPLVQTIDTPEIAPTAARAFLKLKKARDAGRAWLRAHPRTALLRLIPSAVGAPGEERDAAEYALRWFKTENPDALTAALAQYAGADPQFPAAIEQGLARDPLSRTPSKVGKSPAWLSISALARPKLKIGGVLPDEAIAALVEMLSFVNAADVYAGVPMLRDACTAESLAAFSWDLFSAWLAAGAPSKDGWALRAVGWFGDDECARQLTRLVRKWPGEAAHARAVTGLDVLAEIGSDVALMNLNGIAEKLKFKGLQEKACEKIAVIAEARDLSPEELADRLVPDLDLDERGGLDLDFGPRRFRVGFDEFLKPWVKDAAGARLKDLPKPAKSDDAELSTQASARWSSLKKDARAISSLQLTRLENMLASGRKIKGDVFSTFFAAHPLIRHLSQRLVWAVYEQDGADAQPRSYFRVTEDLSFTDAGDNAVTIDVTPDAESFIGLAHPLHMSQAEQSKWGTLFGDYEIAQPFPQLGRETYALTEAEKAADTLTRFEGIEVESARLRGVGARGWPTGSPQDGGGIWWIERKVVLAGGVKVRAMLEFANGLVVGGADFEDKTQTLGKITLNDNIYQKQNAHRFGELDAVTASEIVRAITVLAQTGIK